MSTVEREWRNRQTRTFEGRVGRLVRVQVPSLAPKDYHLVVLIFLFKSAVKPLFKPYLSILYIFQNNSKYVKTNRKCNPNATHKNKKSLTLSSQEIEEYS